ncbi:hypothetical protein ABT352_14835 [Streptosporangium sp. NPDC000563]|uniref:hypothetical protein n=1 Tax=Streptosporangium sp. NPDC000563 TaxID=3154366 RepID=UPI0033275D5D
MTPEETPRNPKITPQDVEIQVTDWVITLFAEMFGRPDAMAVTDAWLRGEVVFLVTRSGLAVAPNDGSATEPLAADVEPAPMPGNYL